MNESTCTFHVIHFLSGCPEGYSLGIYPQFKDINTQVAEQRNATLKKIKPMLSYMNFDMSKPYKLFIWFRSMGGCPG